MTFGWLFLVIFPIGNKGGPNWRCRILESERRARWQERAAEERREKGTKKKDGPGKQDQQMAALNTWDDSITDKSQEEVAAGWVCRSSKRPDRAALDDLRGPPFPRSLCGPTGPSTRGPRCKRRERKKRKITLNRIRNQLELHHSEHILPLRGFKPNERSRRRKWRTSLGTMWNRKIQSNIFILSKIIYRRFETTKLSLFVWNFHGETKSDDIPTETGDLWNLEEQEGNLIGLYI